MAVVRIPVRLILLTTLSGVLCAGSAPAQQKHTPHKKHPAATAKAATPEPAPAPAPPPPPPTLEQMPASPPQVVYRDDKLTIIAGNSTLGDILREVAHQTGAQIDVPAGASERVVMHLGPGPARQVLSQLLDGSRFNYVLLGSVADPGGVKQIILSVKPAAPAPGTAVANQSSFSPGNSAQFSAQNQGDDADSSDDDDSDTSDSDNPPETQPAQPQPQQPQAPAVKTPQQMLEELQRQLQQQQQQGGSPSSAPPPDQPQQIQRRDQR